MFRVSDCREKYKSKKNSLVSSFKGHSLYFLVFDFFFFFKFKFHIQIHLIVMTDMFPYTQCLSAVASRMGTKARPFHTRVQSLCSGSGKLSAAEERAC